ncbi:hypothetical protein AAFF_G00217370 [Aldrovandia affinis]|uniref:Uncharacterized protein n=1 Tax=Aldrovandia affinis TaxID=143900 RepID=A0AAD7WUN5_9TELE|nr:hypothetical protein AAFF_G00217370 [Aldrovandia affinis]
MPRKRTLEVADDAAKVKKEGELRRSKRLSEKPNAPIPEAKAKKTAPKKPAEKAVKVKKGAKGKKEEKPEDVPAENGETKIDEETEAAEPVAEDKE